VIANAGLGILKPVDELSAEEWNDMIETNLTGVFYTLKASVEELKKTEGYYITFQAWQEPISLKTEQVIMPQNSV
jgi:NADP-dependent 3-hydroxy acid dehydrogenase YdfG